MPRSRNSAFLTPTATAITTNSPNAPAICPPAAPKSVSTSSTNTKAPKSTGIASHSQASATTIDTVTPSQLNALLSKPPPVVIIKFYASYCRSCKGVAPKYRKIAAAYSNVKFLEMDYQANEDFCQKMGVRSLPFFAVYQNGNYMGGEPMAWTSVGRKLVDKIESALSKHQHSCVET